MNRRSILIGAGAALTLPAFGARAATATITGAGASFPNPIYQKWAEAAKSAIDIQLNYQSVGSGAGINQIKNRTVDFGASDAPVAADKLASGNLLQFPTVMGSVVPIVNIPGVEIDQLRLTGELIAEIYMGKLARWNDPRIAELNPGVTLPNLAVAPVYRAEGSGTTFVWTSYLAATSATWKSGIGAATSVRWPVGVGARGNDGVAATVRNTRGAIGYVENAYATVNKLTTTQLRNRDGNFIKPTHESFTAAAAAGDWANAPNFAVDLINLPGAQTWPVVSATFILLPTNPTDVERSRNTMRFFDWAFSHGGQAAGELEYIPLPANVQEAVRAAWQKALVVEGRPVWTR